MMTLLKKRKLKKFVKHSLEEFKKENESYKKLYENVQETVQNNTKQDNVLIIEFDRKAFQEHIEKKIKEKIA